MRPVRTIATAFLVASLAVAGCGRSQPDPPTTPTVEPPAITTPRVPAPVPTPRPRILSVTTTPTLERDGPWLRLPAAGTVIFRVRAANTTAVRFTLTPTGTNTADLTKLLGEDTNGRDGWTLAWQYQDRPLLAHLTVKAVGPGGTSPDTVLGLYHPDPVS
ncbi:MAG TPA: hypothetical protein VL330_24610 [Actinomycetes bacterium]|nr:hypothetical protein [Actinomycetes bacterium]